MKLTAPTLPDDFKEHLDYFMKLIQEMFEEAHTVPVKCEYKVMRSIVPMVKVISTIEYRGNYHHTSVYCFITIDDGNIWYPASWTKASFNSPRGNIYNEQPAKGFEWTGPPRLK